MVLAAELCAVTKCFGPLKALCEVDLQVPEGGIFGVIGANGAGKTTAMNLLQGYEGPDGGCVRVMGREPAKLGRAERARIGAQLDRGGLPPGLRARETLAFFRGFYRDGETPSDLLEALGLEAAAEQLVGDLSTGQYRRLAVAAAVVGRPELVFLDEPSLGLDPVGRRMLWRVLRATAARGATILLATNTMEEAESLCDRVAFLRAGRVEVVGSPRSLIERYTPVHRIEFDAELDTETDAALLAKIAGLGGAVELRREAAQTVLLSRDPSAAIGALLTLPRGRLPRFRWVAPRLEDAFHELGERGA